MTEYKNEVEYQRKRLQAEEWGSQIKYLMAQDGYLETARNNGQVTREYRDGRFEILTEPMPLKEVMLHCPYDNEPKSYI